MTEYLECKVHMGTSIIILVYDLIIFLGRGGGGATWFNSDVRV